MVSSSYQQPPLVSDIAAVPSLPTDKPTRERGAGLPSVAREDSANARWYVRVALTADPDMVVQSVRVIIDDRDMQRIVLHSVWNDWHDVPVLAAHITAGIPLVEPIGATAWDLAAALLTSLQRDADGCLAQLSVPVANQHQPRVAEGRRR